MEFDTIYYCLNVQIFVSFNTNFVHSNTICPCSSVGIRAHRYGRWGREFESLYGCQRNNRMRLATVQLPNLLIPTPGSFTNLNGWWKPPVCVKNFWATGAQFEFEDDADYMFNKLEIMTSYRQCVSDYYRTFPCWTWWSDAISRRAARLWFVCIAGSNPVDHPKIGR